MATRPRKMTNTQRRGVAQAQANLEAKNKTKVTGKYNMPAPMGAGTQSTRNKAVRRAQRQNKGR